MALIPNLTQGDISLGKLYSQYTDEQSDFFKWRGIQVHFKDESEGTPILLLHGTSSSLHTWDMLTELLKPKYRVIRMDLVGSGITGPHVTQDYSLEMYLSFISDFVDFLKLEKFAIAGNSWGGILAWNYAAQNPQKISGLILINSAGFKMHKTPTRFKLAQFRWGRWLLKSYTPKWMVKKGLKEVVHSEKIEKSTVIRYQAMMLRRGNRQAFIDFIKMRQQPKTEKLERISAPTLLLWGRHDKLYPLQQAHLFKEKIGNAKLKVIENSAHIPMEEAPLACKGEIEKFINSLEKKTLCVPTQN